MTLERTPWVRPYWHVDAKWIIGLLLLPILSAALLVSALVQVTDEKPAVDTLTITLAVLLSENGLDDSTALTAIREKMQASPNQTVQIIPGSRWTVSEAEIAGLTPRQARLAMFRKVAVPLYRDGIQGLIGLTDDPEMQAAMQSGGAAFNILTLKTHQLLQEWQTTLTIVCLILLIPLILFSARFGRIGSPGCVLVVASLPGAVILGILATINTGSNAPLGHSAGAGETLNYLAGFIVPPLAQLVAIEYWIALAIGAGLVILALFTNLLWRLFRKH